MVTNTVGVNFAELSYQDSCHTETIRGAFAELKALGISYDNPWAPVALVMRSGEAVDAIRNFAATGTSEAPLDSATFLLCGVMQLGGVLYLALLMPILLLLVFAITALSLGLAFALPGHIELIAVIFVANLPLLFASTALAPLSFMPTWLGWLAALNPLTFAIEPIRAAYQGPLDLSAVLLEAPYGDVTGTSCLLILLLLTIGLFLAIRPLLNRKLS